MNKKKLPDMSKLYSLAAEAAVLGSMIIDPACIGKVLPKLPRAEAFFLPEHQTIYNALLKLYVGNVPIDAISLGTELRERGKLEEIGGVEYIGKIVNTVPSSANAAYYAGIVRDKERERKVRQAVTEIAGIVDEPGSVSQMVERIQSLALGLEMGQSGDDFTEVKSVATDIAVDMRDEGRGLITTGFRELDKLIGGFYPGEMVVIGGRPSMGKSALALDLALNMSKTGTGVFFSSLEMSVRSIVKRAICNLACVDLKQVIAGQVNEQEWEEIYQQAFELAKRNIILSTIAETPEVLAGLLHRLKETHGIGVCFVDYAQLMGVKGRTESRQQEITKISLSLKHLAQREHVPVVALSQLNRQVDARENHRPRLSDLRESGALEQDADLVLLVFRSDYYDARKHEPDFEPSGIVEVTVAKNRRGPTGVVRLAFVHDYVRFSNLLETRV